MSKKPRLLWFNLATDADAPVQGFATDWINALAPRCAAIDVLTMRAGRVVVADNVRVFSVGKEKGYGEARRAIEFYRILPRLLRENPYDACFAHMQPLFAMMSAPLLKPRGISITLWYAHKSVTARLRLAEKLVDQVVTSSPEGFRIDSPKVRVIGQGIDTGQFTPAAPPGGRFTIVTVSRIAPVKKLETILQAARLLVDEECDFRLRIIGNVNPQDEAYAQGLRTLAAELGLNEHIEFVGEVAHHHIVREYQQAHLMVNTSSTGSVDKAVLEAMACAVPVISANEAFAAILPDELRVPLDAPDALAAKIRAMMQTAPNARRALGYDLRAVVLRDHSLDHLADALMQLFPQGRS